MLALVLAIGLMPATAAGATVALDTIVDVDPRAKVTISQRTGRLIVRGCPTTTPPGIQVTGADVRVGGDRRSRQLVIVTGRQRRDRDTVVREADDAARTTGRQLLTVGGGGPARITITTFTGDVQLRRATSRAAPPRE
jgi:hypothetical protein